MTEEELEKFTVDFMNNETGTNWSRIDSIMGKMLIKYAEVFQKRIEELEKENAELKEFYEKEYFEIADRTADEKIKELEKYQTEVTVDDYSPYDENTWGMMHEEMFVPKELVRVLLKESYALSEHRNDQLTKAKEIIREFMKYEINEYDGSLEIHFEELKKQAEQFLSEVEK